jgi:hypothetical protein
MTRLLITGVPGTGKSTLGDHLDKAHGFRHVDMEQNVTCIAFLQDPEKFVLSLSEPVVITWGFRPVPDRNRILFLKQHQYFLVWMDGNRWASLRAFLQRDTVEEIAYYFQLFNIEQSRIIEQIQPHAIINPFQTDGSFRPTSDVANEVLSLSSA